MIYYRDKVKVFFIKKTIDQFCFSSKGHVLHIELKEAKNITHLIL